MTTKIKWIYPKTGKVKRGDFVMPFGAGREWRPAVNSVGDDIALNLRLGWRIRRPVPATRPSKPKAKGKVHRFWVNVYLCDLKGDLTSCIMHDSKHSADVVAHKSRIACICVSFTEGQGLK